MPDFNLFQRVENFFEQRKTFRAQALKNLRQREGLPQPVDENGAPLETRIDDLGRAYYVSPDGTRVDHVLFAGAGKDGKPGSFAVGTRKGEARELADAFWHSESEFQILEIAEDGRRLQDELKDLDRDSNTFELSEKVSHGDAGEQAPDLHLAGTSDEEIDETLQKFLKRGL